MQATFKLNMNNPEYVYIIPWLQSEINDAFPWISSSGETIQHVKDQYANAIIVFVLYVFTIFIFFIDR